MTDALWFISWGALGVMFALAFLLAAATALAWAAKQFDMWMTRRATNSGKKRSRRNRRGRTRVI